jgi:hypothetical protein
VIRLWPAAKIVPVAAPTTVQPLVILAATQFAVPRFAVQERIALVVAPPIVQAAVFHAATLFVRDEVPTDARVEAFHVATRSVRDVFPAGNRFAVWKFHFAVRVVHFAAEFCLRPVALE